MDLKKYKYYAKIFIISFLLFIGVAIFYFEVKNTPVSQVKNSPTVSNSDQTKIDPAKKTARSFAPASSTMRPDAHEGYNHYTNDALRYSFDYPADDSLYVCPDAPCQKIEKYTLLVDTLSTSDANVDEPDKLKTADVFCGAEGHEMSQHCDNTEVKLFTNSVGTHGYVIERTKYRETTNSTDGTVIKTEFKDKAYVYFLPKVVLGPKDPPKPSAVVFFVGDLSTDNLNMLNKIATTFSEY